MFWYCSSATPCTSPSARRSTRTSATRSTSRNVKPSTKTSAKQSTTQSAGKVYANHIHTIQVSKKA